jgi:hypothetical protein
MANMITHFVNAFVFGFLVFPIEHLQIFSEEELECLQCGERDSWGVCILSLICHNKRTRIISPIIASNIYDLHVHQF